jgi:hypothetical protein
MQVTLNVAFVLHVLSGVFWAGTTFVLARIGGDQASQLFWPQMGAATVVVLTGALLWNLVHRGTLGTLQGYILALGAFCALLAAGVQGATGAPTLQKLLGAEATERSRVCRHVPTGQRVAAAFLTIAVTCMAAARYI